MRRTDYDGHHVARQDPPPFRVLAVHDVAYLSPLSAAAATTRTRTSTTTTTTTTATTPPPPPRAPEPYKIAPSTTNFGGRAHRRSSFVILAESRPTTPPAPGDADSPTLPTGRISPFRGRGFKGPPPHSMSRPQTPEAAADGRRRGRVERRASVSQQNSPRRSLIPQPTYRQRSSSLTKANNERTPSPAKIGRRADSRTRLNDSKARLNRSDSRSRFISNSTGNLSNATARRQPTTKAPSTRLSPIQGTPTKPERTTPRPARGAREGPAKQSPMKTPRTASQRKGNNNSNVADGRRNDRERGANAGKERVTSPSKIPLKANRNNGALATSSNAGRFITMPEQSSNGSRKVQERNEDGGLVKESRDDKRTDQRSVTRNDRSPIGEADANGHEIDGDWSGRTDDVNLMDLLKQSSSHATAGSSSSERLVNTTTTTAVKPLHIDASPHQDGPDAPSASLASSPAVPASSPLASVPVSQSQGNQKSASPSSSAEAGQPAVGRPSDNDPASDKRDSAAAAESIGGGNAKSNVGGTSARSNVASRHTNGADPARQTRPGNQSSVNHQRTGKNGQGSRWPRPSDARTLEDPGGTTTAVPAEVKNGSRVAVGRETPASDRMPTVIGNDSRVAGAIIEEKAVAEAEAKSVAATATATVVTSDATTTSVNGDNANANAVIGETAIGNASNGARSRARNENRGSDASLKSSAGVSTGSIESVRSTDTGVSVNTVRGVSSPREKTGMHVVKRPQEIETLSGNVVRVEQNGELAALASSDEKQRDSRRVRELWTRWKGSLSRYTKCCPGMRCLACRRDPKGLLWTRNKERPTIISDSPPPPPVAAIALESSPPPPPPPPPPATEALSCWTKLKTRCRCAPRLRDVKCCARRARIAPAESTPCCPPERRFGALCRRVFGRCSCKRRNADTQQRTRNVRAKHSLTSVAPPPLSEEPKAKIPDVLVEHNSVMRGAIPCLPVPLAWFCLVWNVLLPGTGTVWSGLFNLCTGQPRFSSVAGIKSRLGAFIVNLVVGVGQMFTVLFCLVGWGWSIWWGVTMVRLARKYKRVRTSEAASNDPEARGGEPGALPPGVPSQALRGMERAR